MTAFERINNLSKKQGLSLDNYKEQGAVTLNAMKNRDKVQFTKFEILKPIKIFRCNNQFQGIVRQKSFVMVNGNPNSFEGYIIGISDDNNTEITSGLSEGDKIITKTTTVSSSKSKTSSTSTSTTSIKNSTGNLLQMGGDMGGGFPGR